MAQAARGAAGAGPLSALDALLTTEGVRELAASLVSDDLVVLPVRHHSPSCAWHAGEQIRLRRPREELGLGEGDRVLGALVARLPGGRL